MTTHKEALKLALEALGLIEFYKLQPDSIQSFVNYYTPRIKEALAQQCVCGEPDSAGTHRTDGPCLAPQRTWVELTDGDCLEALKALDPETKRLPLAIYMFAANIQAKLKEKNK